MTPDEVEDIARNLADVIAEYLNGESADYLASEGYWYEGRIDPTVLAYLIIRTFGFDRLSKDEAVNLGIL